MAHLAKDHTTSEKALRTNFVVFTSDTVTSLKVTLLPFSFTHYELTIQDTGMGEYETAPMH